MNRTAVADADRGPGRPGHPGRGLAGGLIALALTLRRPEVRLVVVEEATVGGNHIWSHFASDVDQSAGWLVEPLIAHRWPAYDVAFPAHARTLAAPYRSITSERFAEVLGRSHPGALLRLGPGHRAPAPAGSSWPTDGSSRPAR